MSFRSFRPALGFILALSCVANAWSQQQGYYRNPSVRGKTVIFTAEGDLWKHDVGTGLSMRLTTHPGLETNASISPDGKWVAFTGQYEGSNEVYLIGIDGGVPQRLTYDFGLTRDISGWTSDGKIITAGLSSSTVPDQKLQLIDPVDRSRTTVPLAQAAMGAYDPAGNLYFVRFPNQGSKTKRYKGGLIEQVWRFDGKNEAVNLTGDFEGTSTSPMTFQDRIFFLSDRDGTMNIWSMNASGKDLRQQTFSKGWDLQSPAIDGGTIVYQKGADLCVYDIASNKERMLSISLISDFDQRKPRWIKSPAGSVSEYALSPNGQYAAIISRGRVFVSPAKSDRWVEVTRKSGIRHKLVSFINNKTLAFVSDASGEYEVWKANADGSDTAVQITRGSKTMIDDYLISPDQRMIAYRDKNEVLRVAEVSTGAVRYTYDSSHAGFEQMSWSPDSRFLVFTELQVNETTTLTLLDRNTFKKQQITTPRINSSIGRFTSDGKWLYFVSERSLVSRVRSPWGPRQPEPYYTDVSNIYALALDSTAKFPFTATDSWLADSVFTNGAVVAKTASAAGKGKSDKEKNTGKARASKPVSGTSSYDWSAISRRLFQVPGKGSTIVDMAVAGDHLYWLTRSDDPEVEGGMLYSLKMEEEKEYEPTLVASRVTSFQLASEGKKILVVYLNRSAAIADANGSKVNLEKDALSLANWSFVVNPQQEWQEMFDDAWRMLRDYFYDRELHQVDWASIRTQYQPLVSRLTDRYELDDLLSQMVGELSALHTFVYGGDQRRSPDQIPVGFLGARLSRLDKGLRIDHIYTNDPDYPELTSPLAKSHLRIREGDLITEINNVPVGQVPDYSELLANKVDQPVKLTLLNAVGQRYEQVVRPCSAQSLFTLKYEEWEYMNRLKTDSLSNSDIGYLHLKAMTGNDMDDFVKQFYPIFNRSGLVIDVRHNNGGNIDSWVLEKLMRKAWMYWQRRSGGPYWNMQYAFRGHMVILCDQTSASDGEAVAEGFRRLGLGKVIGMRTWGGEIWLSSTNRMVDNGIASAAEMGVYGPEKTWLIEGRGVEPDVVVDNLPYESYRGRDAQLEYAIDFLKKEIAAKPVAVPVAPKHPDKSFRYPK